MASVVEFLLSGFTDNSGNPLAGGKVYTYQAGTTTPKDTYTDSAAATPEANPVILDSNGRKQVYADGSYKFVVRTSADVLLYTLDNLFFGSGSGATFLGTTTGASNVYTAAPTPALSAYTDGALFSFQAHQINTGSATLNISGLGAKNVTGIAGSIITGRTYLVRYKSSTDTFQIVNPDASYATTQAEMEALNTAGIEIVVKQAITLSGALTLTAPLRIEDGGMITTGSNILTINGSFKCGLFQCFTTAVDKVVFGPASTPEVYPQWFGAIADNTTDCADAFNFALASVKTNGGIVSTPKGNYKVNDTLNIGGSNIEFRGNNAKLSFNEEAIGILVNGVYGTPIENINIHGFQLIQLFTGSTNGSQQVIQANYVRRIKVTDNYVQDWAVGVKFNSDCKYVWAERNHFSNIGAGGVGGIGIYVEGNDAGVPAETYNNDHVYISYNHVDTCIYGCEVKFVRDFLIHGNIVENTSGLKYGILCVRDAGSGSEDATQRGVISNNIVKNCTGEGIFAKGVNVVVEGNVVEDTTTLAYHLAGANIIMANNIAYNCFSAASIVYDASAITGGGFDTTVDSAKFAVVNNLFQLITGTDPAVSFNACSDSLIQGNQIHDYQGTGGNAYGYKFLTCTNSRILDNYVDGGIYGYRLETDSTGMTFRNNKAINFTSYDVSIPGAHLGWMIEDGGQQSRRFARLQTTDATPIALASYTIATSDSAVHLRAKVNVKSTSGIAIAGAYDIEVLVKRASGSLSVVGSVGVLYSAETDAGLDATWAVSGSVVSLNVTGIAATNLNWQAEIERIDCL